MRLAAISILLFAGGMNAAHAQVNMPWPAAGSVAHDTVPAVTARASGQGQGKSSFRASITIIRTDDDPAKVETQLTAAIEELPPADANGVAIASTQRIPAQLNFIYCGSAGPISAADMRSRYQAIYRIEIDALTRETIVRWAAKLSPQPNPCATGSPVQVYPVVMERMAETDPAWTSAATSALAASRRDAEMMATAANATLGRLVGVWVERSPAILDGKVTVQVTAQYEISPRR